MMKPPENVMTVKTHVKMDVYAAKTVTHVLMTHVVNVHLSEIPQYLTRTMSVNHV